MHEPQPLTLRQPITILVPGEPVPQGRGRIAWPFGKAKPAIMDPPRARSWKGVAQTHYMAALVRFGLQRPLFRAGVAVELHVVAVFPCPKADYRKRNPVGRRPHTKDQGDASNVLKAVEDAGNTVLWADDCQIARVTVDKWIGAQDEAPYVEVTVQALRCS
jgi:Holliday junction resolvase RusA-like endonuclease